MSAESARYQQQLIACQALLDELMFSMQQGGVWSADVPSQEALSSALPFACDQLTFAQWLQFIFIPTLRRYIDQRLPLPTHSNMLAMAQTVMTNHSDLHDFFAVLQQLDTLLNQGKPCP